MVLVLDGAALVPSPPTHHHQDGIFAVRPTRVKLSPPPRFLILPLLEAGDASLVTHPPPCVRAPIHCAAVSDQIALVLLVVVCVCVFVLC